MSFKAFIRRANQSAHLGILTIILVLEAINFRFEATRI
jgi:hypothetical protein